MIKLRRESSTAGHRNARLRRSAGRRLPPDAEEADTARIDLPKDGDYTIRVYLMGNDRDTNKTVGYNLDLSIQ